MGLHSGGGNAIPAPPGDPRQEYHVAIMQTIYRLPSSHETKLCGNGDDVNTLLAEYRKRTAVLQSYNSFSHHVGDVIVALLGTLREAINERKKRQKLVKLSTICGGMKLHTTAEKVMHAQNQDRKPLYDVYKLFTNPHFLRGNDDILAQYALLMMLLLELSISMEQGQPSILEPLLSTRPGRGRLKFAFEKAAQLVLWLSHDVESNPGPSYYNEYRAKIEAMVRVLSSLMCDLADIKVRRGTVKWALEHGEVEQIQQRWPDFTLKSDWRDPSCKKEKPKTKELNARITRLWNILKNSQLIDDRGELDRCLRRWHEVENEDRKIQALNEYFAMQKLRSAVEEIKRLREEQHLHAMPKSLAADMEDLINYKKDNRIQNGAASTSKERKRPPSDPASPSPVKRRCQGNSTKAVSLSNLPSSPNEIVEQGGFLPTINNTIIPIDNNKPPDPNSEEVTSNSVVTGQGTTMNTDSEEGTSNSVVTGQVTTMNPDSEEGTSNSVVTGQVTTMNPDREEGTSNNSVVTGQETTMNTDSEEGTSNDSVVTGQETTMNRGNAEGADNNMVTGQETTMNMEQSTAAPSSSQIPEDIEINEADLDKFIQEMLGGPLIPAYCEGIDSMTDRAPVGIAEHGLSDCT